MFEQISLYNIDVCVLPKTKELKARVNLDYINSVDGTQHLKFYIHKDIVIKDITCNHLVSYAVGDGVEAWCPFVLESKVIQINLAKPINAGEALAISFDYSGVIDIVTQYGVNRISEDWVELGLYTPWFPLNPSLEYARFDVRLTIDDAYSLISSFAKKVAGTWQLQIDKPQMDCTLLALKTNVFALTKTESLEIKSYAAYEAHRGIATTISQLAGDITAIYTAFGPLAQEQITFVVLPRNDGGGYCRPDMIVLTADEAKPNDLNYFKYIAHEVAHMWWGRAYTNSWEDWLNESFAEYSALMAVRVMRGEKEFSEIIERYISKSKDLPPIEGLCRADEKAYAVLYQKGPTLLYALECKIGRESFLRLFQIIYTENVITTQGLLETIVKLFDQEIALWFSTHLKI